MFDTIGHTHDDDANQRRAATAILLTVMGSGALGLGLMVTAWTAQNVVEGPEDWGHEFHEPPPMTVEIPVELPGVPEPPPPLVARGEPAETEPEPTPPDEFVDIPPVLVEPPDTRVVDTTPKIGVPDGHDSGTQTSGDPGDHSGVPSGTGIPGGPTGNIGVAIPTVSVRNVQMRRSVTPDYPDAARDMNLGMVDCRVRVQIDPDGRPADVAMKTCPSVFHDEVRQAVQRTRWYPYRVDGEKSQAQFDILYRFQPQ